MRLSSESTILECRKNGIVVKDTDTVKPVRLHYRQINKMQNRNRAGMVYQNRKQSGNTRKEMERRTSISGGTCSARTTYIYVSNTNQITPKFEAVNALTC
jgi:hypothetical protein